MLIMSLPSLLLAESPPYCSSEILNLKPLPAKQAADMQELLNHASQAMPNQDPVLEQIQKREKDEAKQNEAKEKELKLYQSEKEDLEKFIESKKEDLAYSLYYGAGIDDQIRAMQNQSFEYLSDPKNGPIDWQSYRERFISDEELNKRDWKGADAYPLKQVTGFDKPVPAGTPLHLGLNYATTVDVPQIYSRREDQIKHLLAEKLLSPYSKELTVRAGEIISLYSLDELIQLSFIKDYISDFDIAKNNIDSVDAKGKIERLSAAEIDAKAREVFEFESKLANAFDEFPLIFFRDWKDFQNQKPKILEAISHIQRLAPGISFENLGWTKNQDCSQAFAFPGNEVKAVSLKDYRAIKRHSKKMKVQDRLKAKDSQEVLRQLQNLDECLTKRSDKLKEELSIDHSWTLPQLTALEFLYKRYGWDEAFFVVNGQPMTLGDFRAILNSKDPLYLKMTAQFLSSAQQMAGREGLVLTIYGKDWQKYFAPSANGERPNSHAVTEAAAQAEEVIEALTSYQLWARQNFDYLSLQTGVAQAPQRLKWVRDEFQKRLGSVLTKNNVPRERWDKLREQAAEMQLESLISEFPILESTYFYDPADKPNSFIGRVYAQYQEQTKAPLQDYEMMFGRNGKDRDTQKSTALSMEAANRDAGNIYRSGLMRDGAFLQNFFNPVDKEGLHSFFVGEKAPARLEKRPEEFNRMLVDLGLRQRGLINEYGIRAMEMTGITWTPDFLKFLNREGFEDVRNDYQNFSKALFEMGQSLVEDFESTKPGLKREDFKKLIHLYLENPKIDDKTFADILRTPSDVKNGGLIERLLTNPMISIKEADAKDILSRAHMEEFWPEDNKELRARVLDQLARLRVFLLATHSIMGSEISAGTALNDQAAFMQGSSLNQEIFNTAGKPTILDQQLWIEDRLEKMWKSMGVLSYSEFDPFAVAAAFAKEQSSSLKDSFTPFFKSLGELIETQLSYESAQSEEKIEKLKSDLPKNLQEDPAVLGLLHFLNDKSHFTKLSEAQIYDLKNTFKEQKAITLTNRLNALKGFFSSGMSGKTQLNAQEVTQFLATHPGFSFTEFLKRARAVAEASLDNPLRGVGIGFSSPVQFSERDAARGHFLKLFPEGMREIPAVKQMISSVLDADYQKIKSGIASQQTTNQKNILDEAFKDAKGESEALNRRKIFTVELNQQALIADRLAELERISDYVLGRKLGWDRAKLSKEILDLQAEGKFDFDNFSKQLAVAFEYQAERQIEGTYFFENAEAIKAQIKPHLDNLLSNLPEEFKSEDSALKKLLEDLSNDELWKIQPESYLGIRLSNLGFALTGAPHLPKNLIDGDAWVSKFKNYPELAKIFLKDLGRIFSLQLKLNKSSDEGEITKVKSELDSLRKSVLANLPEKISADSDIQKLVESIALPGALKDYKEPEGLNPFQQTLLSVFENTPAARKAEFDKNRNKMATDLVSSLISSDRGTWFQNNTHIIAPFSNSSDISAFHSKFLLNPSNPLAKGDPLLLQEEVILSDLYGSEFKMVLESFGPEYEAQLRRQAREIGAAILDIENRLSSKVQSGGLTREDLKKIFESQLKIEKKNNQSRENILNNTTDFDVNKLMAAFAKQRQANPLFENQELTPQIISELLSQSGVKGISQNSPELLSLMKSFQKAVSLSHALIEMRSQAANVIQSNYENRRAEQIVGLTQSLRAFSKTSERENLNPKDMLKKLQDWSNEKSKGIQETRKLTHLQMERSKLGLGGLPLWDQAIRGTGFFLKSGAQGAWGMTSGAGIDVARFVYNSGEAGRLIRLSWTATDEEFVRGISQMGDLEEDPVTGKLGNDFRQTLSGFNRHLMSDESAFATHWAWYIGSAAIIGKAGAMARLRSLGLTETTTSKWVAGGMKERSLPGAGYLSKFKKPKVEIAAQAGIKSIQETNQILGRGAKSLLASGKDLSLLKSTLVGMKNFALPRGGEFGKLLIDSGLFTVLTTANKAYFTPKDIGMDPNNKLKFFGTGQFWLGTLPQEFAANIGFFLAMRYQSLGLRFVEMGMPNLAFLNHYIGKGMSFHIYSMMGKGFTHMGIYKMTADPVDRKYDPKTHEWIYPNEIEAQKGQELDAVTQEFWNQAGMGGIMLFTHNAHHFPEMGRAIRQGVFGAAPSRTGTTLGNMWNYIYRRPDAYSEQTIQIAARDLALKFPRTANDVKGDPVEAYRVFMTTPDKTGMSLLEKNIRNALHGIGGQVNPSKTEVDRAIAKFNTNFEIGVRAARDMQLKDSALEVQAALDVRNLFKLKDPEAFVGEVKRREGRFQEIMKDRERLGLPYRKELEPSIQNTSLNSWTKLIQEIGFDPVYFKHEGSKARAELFAQRNLSALNIQTQALKGPRDEIGARGEIKSPDGKTIAYENRWFSAGDPKKYKAGDQMARDSMELNGTNYELRYYSALSTPKVFQDGSIVFNGQKGESLMITPDKKVLFKGVGNQEVLSFDSLDAARNVFARLDVQLFDGQNLVTPLVSVQTGSPVPVYLFDRAMKKPVQVSEFKPLTARISERAWIVDENVSSNPLLRSHLLQSVRGEIIGNQAGMRYPVTLPSQVFTRRYAMSEKDGAEPVVYETTFRNSIRIDIKKGEKTYTLRLPAMNAEKPYQIDIEKNLIYIEGPANLFLKIDLASEKFEMIDRVSGQVRVVGNLSLWEKVAERFTVGGANATELSSEDLFRQLLSVRYKGMPEAVAARQQWSDNYFEVDLKADAFKIYRTENGKRVDLLDGPLDVWEKFSTEVAKSDRVYVSDLPLHDLIPRYIKFAKGFSGVERMKYIEMEKAGTLPEQTYLPEMIEKAQNQELAAGEQVLAARGFKKEANGDFINSRWQGSDNYKFEFNLERDYFEISKKDGDSYKSVTSGKLSEWDAFEREKSVVMTEQGPARIDLSALAPDLLVYDFKEFQEKSGLR
ncbi:MAG: hypothetical protein J0L93_07300 [Deltaproteobacteria bacterium]|nr:hypothetical protein [Deltaproteobacteria bacterium]